MTRSFAALLGACALFATACGDEASVGAQPGDCFEGMECVYVELPDYGQVLRWSTDIEEALAPSWVRTELNSVPIPAPVAINNYGLAGQRNIAFLATGADGTLWMFMAKQEDTELLVYRLNEAGEVLDSGTVNADLPHTSATHILFATGHSHPQGPVVLVTWGTDCRTDRSGGIFGECEEQEALVFGETADAAPVRIRPGDVADGMSLFLAHRTRTGDAVIVSGWGLVRKFDLDGALLWEAALPSSFSDQYGVVSATLSPNESVVYSPHEAGPPPSGWRPYVSPLPLKLVEVGEDTQKLLSVTFSAGFSLATSPPGVGYDPQGRMLLVLPEDNGNLGIARSDMEQTTDLLFLMREHYAALTPEAIAMDPAGDLYISLAPGGLHERTPLICRVRNSFDDVHCVKVDGLPVSMQAPREGVVYAVSVTNEEPEPGQTSDALISLNGLQRYDFPD